MASAAFLLPALLAAVERLPARLVAVRGFAGLATDGEVERQREAIGAAMETHEDVELQAQAGGALESVASGPDAQGARRQRASSDCSPSRSRSHSAECSASNARCESTDALSVSTDAC